MGDTSDESERTQEWAVPSAFLKYTDNNTQPAEIIFFVARTHKWPLPHQE